MSGKNNLFAKALAKAKTIKNQDGKSAAVSVYERARKLSFLSKKRLFDTDMTESEEIDTIIKVMDEEMQNGVAKQESKIYSYSVIYINGMFDKSNIVSLFDNLKLKSYIITNVVDSVETILYVDKKVDVIKVKKYVCYVRTEKSLKEIQNDRLFDLVYNNVVYDASVNELTFNLIDFWIELLKVDKDAVVKNFDIKILKNMLKDVKYYLDNKTIDDMLYKLVSLGYLSVNEAIYEGEFYNKFRYHNEIFSTCVEANMKLLNCSYIPRKCFWIYDPTETINIEMAIKDILNVSYYYKDYTFDWTGYKNQSVVIAKGWEKKDDHLNYELNIWISNRLFSVITDSKFCVPIYRFMFIISKYSLYEFLKDSTISKNITSKIVNIDLSFYTYKRWIFPRKYFDGDNMEMRLNYSDYIISEYLNMFNKIIKP